MATDGQDQLPAGQIVYQVYVNEVLYQNKPWVMDGQLDQTYGEHDIFFLRLELDRNFVTAPEPTPSQLSIWPDDVPIRVVWGRAPNYNTWYGYVNHHENNSISKSGTNLQEILYVCIGTSMPMNIDVTRKWENVSPTYIAKTIAKETSLRAVVTPLSGVVTDEMQQCESNFNFLNKIADKFGMRFFVSGGTLYFLDPAIALFGNQASEVPVFYHDKTLIRQDTIRWYKKLSGLNMPSGIQTKRILHGIDHKTGQVFKAKADPPVSTSRIRHKKDFSVTSYHQGKQKVDAEQNIEQFFVGCQAQLFGHSLLYPGKLVDFQGWNLPGNMAGQWLIISAKHQLMESGWTIGQTDKYATDVELVRNSEAGVIMLKAQQPVIPEIVSCHLADKLWVSDNQAVISEPV